MVVISLRMVIRPFYDELFNYFDKKNCFFYNNIVNLLTRFRRVKLLIAEIAICDDEELVIANLQRKISTCFDTHNAPYNISCYTNARDLLKEVSKFNLIFLDYEMPGLNGVDAGIQIIKLNPSCKIVMATSHTDVYKDAFRFSAFRYITKPFDAYEISEAIDSFYSKMSEGHIIVFKNRVQVILDVAEISCVTAYNGYTLYYANGYEYRNGESLSTFELISDKRYFQRISKGIIVNMRMISAYVYDHINIDTKSLEITRRRRKAFNQAFIHFKEEF